MEHLEPLTPEYPRESFRGRLINYTPSICIVAFMFIVPLPWSYQWSSLASQWIGLWGYALFIASVSLTLGYIGFIYRTRPAHFPPLQSVDNITNVCRAACILFNLLIFTAWGNSIIILVTVLLHIEDEQHLQLKIVSLSASILLLGYHEYSTYLRCRWNYHERAIMRQNAERYGEPLLVSIPVFKLCGHFVLYTTTNKYELRLDRATGFRPYFLHRPHRDIDITNGSPRYHFFVSGWTSSSHEDIIRIFNEAIAEFGEYNRITNNCRTFLQFGCSHIIRTTSAWHEDMLMVEPGHLWLLGQMAIMMYRAMLRDVCRWIWTVKWGPDWESIVQYHGEFVDLADDAMSQRMAHIFD
ncbi:hypothetical protein J3R30DRAFT_3507396 [Lentinula aciculospora]|uniref:Uncharacterized protein n=1 Tax=Lentinula aciculospora TaxID=153920 RepID=A0A9W9A4G6_9AGAR|nr:hypothetical protein J3R30DRAFT_3507396 [Lentinula aciculospora]